MRSLLCILLCLAAAMPAFGGGDPLDPRDPRGILSRDPYVQMPTQTSAVIVWRTSAPTLAVLSYGTAPDQLTNVVFPTQMTIKLGPGVVGAPDALRLHSAPPGTYQYEALITGLTPDSKFYYSICDGTDLLAGGDEDHFFYTLPVAGTEKPMRLWVVGDSGNGSAVQIAAFDAMRSTVVQEQRPVDHYIHVGDMAYNVGLDSEFSAYFFDIYGELLRNTPVWAAMGNHEGYTSRGQTGVGPYYDAYAIPKNGECGGVASGTEAYYSFDIGKAHFVVLNSYDLPRVPTGAMAQWLQADLEQTDADWLIAFWHHPPYTKGTHNSDTEVELIEMRTYILPILESAGVDLTLTGHSHIYERSMLIDGAYTTPTTTHNVVLDDGDGRPAGDGIYLKSAGLVPNEGSLHVVAGNGRSAYNFAISPVMRHTIAEVGSVLIDIDGDELTARMLNSTGDVRDWFTLKKTGVQEVREPLQYPWNPMGPVYQTRVPQAGMEEVVIGANPPAPDAMVYFTTDGSEPNAASPVYQGPVQLPGGTTVKAMSVWRNGTRQSPVSVFTVPPPNAGSIRLPVLSGSGDAEEHLSGEVIVDRASLQLGSSGFRFEDVRIPSGAVVTGATVQFTAALTNALLSDYSIRAELAVDSIPFLSQGFNLSLRNRTTAAVNWSVSQWFQNHRSTRQRTPDLSVLLQQVVDLPGWQPGNAVSFFMEGEGLHEVIAYEGAPLSAAELRLQYSGQSHFEIAASERLNLSLSGGAGQEVLQMSYRRFRSDAVPDFEFVVEWSEDLSAGSWVELEEEGAFVIPGTGTIFEYVNFFSLPLDGPARYYRLKVTGVE